MKTIASLSLIIIVGILLHALTLRGDWGNPDVHTIDEFSAQGQAFESSHERSPYATVLAFDTTGTPELTQELADVGAPDVGYYNKKFYSYFPVGVPAMIYPAYLLGKNYNVAQLATYGMMSIFSIGTMICLYFLSRRMFSLPHWASILTAMMYAFASPAWSYSVTIYQHAITTFLLISGFWGAWSYARGGKWSWLGGVWAAVSYGIGAFVDYPNVIILFPNIMYAGLSAFSFRLLKQSLKVKFRWSVLAVVLAAGVLAGSHAFYNNYYFGNWRTLTNALVRYEGRVKSEDIITADEAELEAQNVEKQNVSGVIVEEHFPHGLYVLLVAEDKGLFVFAPVFILGVIGLFMANSKVDGSNWLTSMVGLNLLVYASFGDPWGGWSFGPRYLVPSMGILSLYSSYLVAKYVRSIWFSLLSLVLLTYSSAIAVLGVITTNTVPPKVEADYFGIKYGFWVNIDMLYENLSSSFAYKSYVSNYLTVWQFYLVLVYYLLIMWIILLLVIPRLNKTDSITRT